MFTASITAIQIENKSKFRKGFADRKELAKRFYFIFRVCVCVGVCLCGSGLFICKFRVVFFGKIYIKHARQTVVAVNFRLFSDIISSFILLLRPKRLVGVRHEQISIHNFHITEIHAQRLILLLLFFSIFNFILLVLSHICCVFSLIYFFRSRFDLFIAESIVVFSVKWKIDQKQKKYVTINLIVLVWLVLVSDYLAYTTNLQCNTHSVRVSISSCNRMMQATIVTLIKI